MRTWWKDSGWDVGGGGEEVGGVWSVGSWIVVIASGNCDLNQERKPVIPLSAVVDVLWWFWFWLWEGGWDGSVCFVECEIECECGRLRMDESGVNNLEGKENAVTMVVSFAIMSTMSSSSIGNDVDKHCRCRRHRLIESELQLQLKLQLQTL